MRQKKGQSWTIDYTIGILFFVIGLGIAFALISDAFANDSIEQLHTDAVRISNTITTQGFPVYWQEQDVLRAGITTNDRVSWRKTELLSQMDEQSIRTILPSSYNYAITLQKNNETIAVHERCSIGTTTLPQATTEQLQNYTTAYYPSGQLLSGFVNNLGAVLYQEDELDILLEHKHRYDIILFENPRFLEQQTNKSRTELQETINNLAKNTKKILLIGDVQLEVFNMELSDPQELTSEVQAHNSYYYDLLENATISYEQGREVTFVQASNEEHISAGTTRSQYYDSAIYYFSELTNAEYGIVSLQEAVEEGLQQATTRATIRCDDIRAQDLDTPELVKIERVLVDKGELLIMNVYVWRNP